MAVEELQSEKADRPCTVGELIESLMDYPLEAPVVFDMGYLNDYQDVAVPVPWIEVTPCSELSGDKGDCGYVQVVKGRGGIRAVRLTWRK